LSYSNARFCARSEDVQRNTRIAIRVSRDARQRVIVRGEPERADPPVAIFQSATEDDDDVFRLEGLEHVHLRPREQRRVHLERRVLGRRADQDDVAGFDAWQKRILLCAIETMDLVDEQDGAAAQPAARFLGFRHHRADLLDAG
jgi:hypothetical protein